MQKQSTVNSRYVTGRQSTRCFLRTERRACRIVPRGDCSSSVQSGQHEAEHCVRLDGKTVTKLLSRQASGTPISCRADEDHCWFRERNQGRTCWQAENFLLDITHQGAMLSHRVSHEERRHLANARAGRTTVSRRCLHHPMTSLDEEKNFSTSRLAKTHRPTMTGASVHVPHLLCPNQLHVLPAALPRGSAEHLRLVTPWQLWV